MLTSWGGMTGLMSVPWLLWLGDGKSKVPSLGHMFVTPSTPVHSNKRLLFLHVLLRHFLPFGGSFVYFGYLANIRNLRGGWSFGSKEQFFVTNRNRSAAARIAVHWSLYKECCRALCESQSAQNWAYAHDF